jgi:hypothetical protein
LWYVFTFFYILVCYPGYTGATCASRISSFAFAAGLGSNGQLGDKYADPDQKSLFRVAGWYGFQTISQLSAGADYSLSITTSGVVHGFG